MARGNQYFQTYHYPQGSDGPGGPVYHQEDPNARSESVATAQPLNDGDYQGMIFGPQVGTGQKNDPTVNYQQAAMNAFHLTPSRSEWAENQAKNIDFINRKVSVATAHINPALAPHETTPDQAYSDILHGITNTGIPAHVLERNQITGDLGAKIREPVLSRAFPRDAPYVGSFHPYAKNIDLNPVNPRAPYGPAPKDQLEVAAAHEMGHAVDPKVTSSFTVPAVKEGIAEGFTDRHKLQGQKHTGWFEGKDVQGNRSDAVREERKQALTSRGLGYSPDHFSGNRVHEGLFIAARTMAGTVDHPEDHPLLAQGMDLPEMPDDDKDPDGSIFAANQAAAQLRTLGRWSDSSREVRDMIRSHPHLHGVMRQAVRAHRAHQAAQQPPQPQQLKLFP